MRPLGRGETAVSKNIPAYFRAQLLPARAPAGVSISSGHLRLSYPGQKVHEYPKLSNEKKKKKTDLKADDNMHSELLDSLLLYIVS